MNDEIDVLPKLLEEVKNEFELAYGESEIIRNAFAKLKAKKATYRTANEFAIEVGEILSKALGASISADKLPDGKMYYNIAQRLLTDVLGRNHEIVSGYASDVQKNLNDEAKIGMKVQVPELNQDRIAGIVNRFSSEDNFEDVSWLLGEPIVNFTQSIIDDTIRKNAEFHAKTGMTPTISRHSTGRCCKWCDSLVGNYIYGEEPNNFYRRHQHCTCVIDYHPKNGKRQNSWTKKFSKDSSNELEIRKQMNIDVRDNNRKADIQEYKEVVAALGVEKSPVSLAKFQDLKYNGGEEYEQLKDKVFIYQKIQTGEWGKKINPDKQLPHMESTQKSGKSYIYDSVDVQELFNKHYGTGRVELDRHGRRTNKEIIELGYPIGINGSDGSEVTSIKIHHSEKRTHIVPKKGDQ
ncbi:polymorphic toxin type 50 domain-containing protein [Streptococcus oralis]|uniref:polymorphic toxin type 50 domain-containing protein n=1 Tax=Streptococcus oralis TaxID=1303 RepID=UPI002284BCD1|nr:polymorphic toxin type 50 domain-containing protein [Streptococcus oralis]MCY7065140.1 polymorphic toxin type 50 domain-containing protein [Streptococcus oralis]